VCVSKSRSLRAQGKLAAAFAALSALSTAIEEEEGKEGGEGGEGGEGKEGGASLLKSTPLPSSSLSSSSLSSSSPSSLLAGERSSLLEEARALYQQQYGHMRHGRLVFGEEHVKALEEAATVEDVAYVEQNIYIIFSVATHIET
jgi:hypothetical protein